MLWDFLWNVITPLFLICLAIGLIVAFVREFL